MILVTVGTGFLGKDLVPELMKIDDVRVVSRGMRKAPFEVMKGDISDPEFCKKVVKGVDCVFHLAKFKGHTYPYEKHYKTTVLGTKNLIEAAIEEGVKKFIHMSTAAVTVKNETPYVRAKKDAEKIVKDSWDKITAPILRPSLIYDRSVIRKMKKQARLPFPHVKQKIHMSYKKSVIEALIGAMKYGKSEVYNVEDKEPVYLTELYEEIAKPGKIFYTPSQGIWLLILLGYPVKFISNLLGIKPPFTPEYIRYIFEDREYDISKAVKTLKYKPVDSLETVKMLK